MRNRLHNKVFFNFRHSLINCVKLKNTPEEVMPRWKGDKVISQHLITVGYFLWFRFLSGSYPLIMVSTTSLLSQSFPTSSEINSNHSSPQPPQGIATDYERNFHPSRHHFQGSFQKASTMELAVITWEQNIYSYNVWNMTLQPSKIHWWNNL